MSYLFIAHKPSGYMYPFPNSDFRIEDDLEDKELVEIWSDYIALNMGRKENEEPYEIYIYTYSEKNLENNRVNGESDESLAWTNVLRTMAADKAYAKNQLKKIQEIKQKVLLETKLRDDRYKNYLKLKEEFGE